MSRRRQAVLALIAITAFTALAACSRAQEASAPAEEPIRTVEVADVTEGVLDEGVTLSGKVKGHIEVPILPKASGRIESIAVAVGSRVRPGDLLIQLETKDVIAQVHQAEAALRAAEAGRESADAQTTTQILGAEQAVKQAEEGVLQAEKGLAAAENARDLAKKNAERLRTLFENGLASQVELEQAENQLKQAEAGLQQAKSAHENAKKALEVATENLKIARERVAVKAANAQVEQARAGLEAARRLLENMRVTAPVGGTVASLPVSVGDMVSPQVVVATIVDMNPAIVTVDVPEQAYRSVAVGDPVTVAVSGERFQGKVSKKDLTPNPQTKAYRVEIEVPNPEGKLVSGLSADVTFAPKGAKKTLLIPAEAYMASAKGGEGHVMVYEDGIVRERKVTVGRMTTNYVEVTSGLKAGEKVVIKGQYLLKDGDPVKLQGSEGEEDQKAGGGKT